MVRFRGPGSLGREPTLRIRRAALIAASNDGQKNTLRAIAAGMLDLYEKPVATSSNWGRK